MIGRKVGVFWPVDEQWYQGTVEEFNAISGEHKLRYKDGDTEWVKIADHTGGNAGGSRKKELSPKGKDSSRGGMEQNMKKNLKVEQQQRISRESSASSGPAVSASVSVSAPDPPAAQSSQQAQAASSRDQQQQQQPPPPPMQQSMYGMDPNAPQPGPHGHVPPYPPFPHSHGFVAPGGPPGGAYQGMPYPPPSGPYPFYPPALPPSLTPSGVGAQLGNQHPVNNSQQLQHNHGHGVTHHGHLVGHGNRTSPDKDGGTTKTGKSSKNGSPSKKNPPKTWSKEEDSQLLGLVQRMRIPVKWSFVAQNMNGRSGKQCRERYVNHLNPRLKNTDWEPIEDATIFHLYNSCGSQWAKMSKMIPGRTDNGIKNRFHNLRRQLEREDEQRMRLSKPSDFPEEIRLDRRRKFPEHLRGKADKCWDMFESLGVLAAQSVLGGSLTRNASKFGPFKKAKDAGEQCARCGLFAPSTHTGNKICTKSKWCIACTRVPPHLCGNLLRECLRLRRITDDDDNVAETSGSGNGSRSGTGTGEGKSDTEAVLKAGTLALLAQDMTDAS